MEKLFVFLSALFAVTVSSCTDWVGPDPVTNYWYTARTHAPMYMEIHLRCPYDSACTSNVTFGYVVQTMERDGQLYSAEDFSYTFVSDEDTGTVSLGSIKTLAIHDDGHVYFSLFDSTDAEKSYDIDLEGVIHSWTRRGDSVDVVLPQYIDNMGIYEQEENQAQQVRWFYGDSLPDRTVTLSYEEKWDDEYDLAGGLSDQSSYGTDSIRVLGYVYWRPDSL